MKMRKSPQPKKSLHFFSSAPSVCLAEASLAALCVARLTPLREVRKMPWIRVNASPAASSVREHSKGRDKRQGMLIELMKEVSMASWISATVPC
jgi:hypothetical protein